MNNKVIFDVIGWEALKTPPGELIPAVSFGFKRFPPNHARNFTTVHSAPVTISVDESHAPELFGDDYHVAICFR